jgi:hydroxyacylglutathione hydrolase
MGLRIERIPTLGDNYTYLLVCESSGEAAVVDAPEETPVVARAEALDVRITKILSTHHHPDHSQANPALAKRYGAPVYGHRSDEGRLPGQTHKLEEGDTISVGREQARILFIPAHTRGHIAYVFDDAQAVFCGDTLFAAGCGRLFEGTPAQMWTSLSALAALPEQTEVYCGHEYTLANIRFALAVEPESADLWERQAREQAKRERGEPTLPSTIGLERRTNPFLRAAVAEVRNAAATHAGVPPAGDVETFAALRAWKNAF